MCLKSSRGQCSSVSAPLGSPSCRVSGECSVMSYHLCVACGKLPEEEIKLCLREMFPGQEINIRVDNVFALCYEYACMKYRYVLIDCV
jgi:hypothetical protein